MKDSCMSKHIVGLTCLVLLAGPVMSAGKLVPLEPSMVTIPAGELLMGSERAKESQPVHPVAIKSFKMGKYEVTAAEFQRFVQATRHRVSPMCLQLAGKRGMADVPNEYRPGVTLLTTSVFEPATCIGWNDARAYAKWLAAETGRKFRLPTEAGLHDPIGNIDEFVEDCWHDSYAGAPSDGSAWITGECRTRVMRGSAWHWRPPHASGRVHTAPDAIGAMAGFRLAEDLSGPAEPARAPTVFETELVQAQRIERERRAKIPDLKPAPR